MKPLYFFELILLAALWGASFLFMRIAVPEFGPIALIEMRTGIGALFLLPLMLWQRKLLLYKNNFFLLFVVGLFSTAIPFCLLSYATLTLSAGYASILNATTPIFTAIVAWLWLKEELTAMNLWGLCVGFFGVFILAFDELNMSSTLNLLPIVAALIATFCYGIGIIYTKNKLQHLDALTIAFGSQFSAAMALLPLAFIFWPETMPSVPVWKAVIVLGVACTGVAFILFFRLIANVGANKAVTVTYLIPFFGVVWGVIFLSEIFTFYMGLGGFFILLGVAFSTGLLTNVIGKKKLR